MPVVVAAHTTRVPVIDGHTITASIALDARPSVADVRHALACFTAARRRSVFRRRQPRRLSVSTRPIARSLGSTACVATA